MANNNPYLAPLQYSGLARYGLQAICCAGGLGTATLIERMG